jgi:ABC-type polysaccharide/polyol phosphate export permease
MYGVVSLVRTALMGRPLDGGALAVSLAATVALLVIGLAVFRRRSADFADLV